MAKKRSSGLAGIDRQLKATRAKIASIKRKESEKKRAVKKAKQLASLKNQLKRLGGSRKRK